MFYKESKRYTNSLIGEEAKEDFLSSLLYFCFWKMKMRRFYRREKMAYYKLRSDMKHIPNYDYVI